MRPKVLADERRVEPRGGQRDERLGDPFEVVCDEAAADDPAVGRLEQRLRPPQQGESVEAVERLRRRCAVVEPVVEPLAGWLPNKRHYPLCKRNQFLSHALNCPLISYHAE